MASWVASCNRTATRSRLLCSPCNMALLELALLYESTVLGCRVGSAGRDMTAHGSQVAGFPGHFSGLWLGAGSKLLIDE
eukprot:3090072-Amphidinium_carterae.2